MSKTYELIDSGNGLKLERFGEVLLSRPASQAVWRPRLKKSAWRNAHGSFSREGSGGWSWTQSVPNHWVVEVDGLQFRISPTDFGHVGLFPEQRPTWRWLTELTSKQGTAPRVLNLFAYSGAATLAAAKGGADVTHLDASKGMITWARENTELNRMDQASIRWIPDDALKFLQREERRGRQYEGIILDPPTFGRGPRGEVFKWEEQILPLLDACAKVLSSEPLFVCLSCHTPGMTPTTLHTLLQQMMHKKSGSIQAEEMLLTGAEAAPLPSGVIARWTCD